MSIQKPGYNPSGLTMRKQRAPMVSVKKTETNKPEQIDHISSYVKRNAKNIVGNRGKEYR